ncbi:MAG: GatB/YqeY domain-containing protein [Salinivirgaceae bacterium]|nr:GatB/YqeY domain-containing protein [Salinivirgaceae bacterium]MBO7433942.1 GatB/YqeY domain-containing protein [Salinivirgaceae bacterium]MBO7594539.1 GatB/YqeY domain-containing protein [Salinivirgaceae bacterium]MBR5166643.1 GatB/YqeY domain-containing protein [Salinivirgaceae bacterium]
MSLYEKVENDIKTAMLAKEKEKLEALRAIKAAFLLAKTEKGASETLSEDVELKVIQKLVKQRKESAELYKSNGRNDLSDKELFEAEVISTYLPAQLSEAEIEAEVRKVVEAVGAKGPQDMGKVMGMANKQLSGKAESRVVAQKVKEILASL